MPDHPRARSPRSIPQVFADCSAPRLRACVLSNPLSRPVRSSCAECRVGRRPWVGSLKLRCVAWRSHFFFIGIPFVRVDASGKARDFLAPWSPTRFAGWSPARRDRNSNRGGCSLRCVLPLHGHSERSSRGPQIRTKAARARRHRIFSTQRRSGQAKDKRPYKKKKSKKCNDCEKGFHPPYKCFHLHPEKASSKNAHPSQIQCHCVRILREQRKPAISLPLPLSPAQSIVPTTCPSPSASAHLNV